LGLHLLGGSCALGDFIAEKARQDRQARQEQNVHCKYLSGRSPRATNVARGPDTPRPIDAASRSDPAASSVASELEAQMLRLAILRQREASSEPEAGGRGPLQAASKLGERLRSRLPSSMADSNWVLAGEGLAVTAALYGGLKLTLGAYRCAARAGCCRVGPAAAGCPTSERRRAVSLAAAGRW
jgi:hypothetical protein